jgi:hypothetical protein
MNVTIKVNRAKVSSPARPAGWSSPAQFLPETAVRAHIAKVGRQVLAGTILRQASGFTVAAALPLVPGCGGPVRTFASVVKNCC